MEGYIKIKGASGGLAIEMKCGDVSILDKIAILSTLLGEFSREDTEREFLTEILRRKNLSSYLFDSDKRPLGDGGEDLTADVPKSDLHRALDVFDTIMSSMLEDRR